MSAKNVGPNNRKIKILVADRSPLFRSGLRSFISAEPDMVVVAEAVDLVEVVMKSRTAGPDLIVLDSSLARELPALVREARCSVLWLAQEETDDELQLALRAGAKAYMVKGSSPAELLAGFRQLALASDEEPSGFSRMVPDLQALAANACRSSGPRTAQLTMREQEVARILAGGRTAREAAAELGLSIKTIEAHKLNLMRKLDLHDRASLTAYAVEAGLVTG
jgi:DNA-binding NarL/FixJ family response regulator